MTGTTGERGVPGSQTPSRTTHVDGRSATALTQDSAPVPHYEPKSERRALHHCVVCGALRSAGERHKHEVRGWKPTFDDFEGALEGYEMSPAPVHREESGYEY